MIPLYPARTSKPGAGKVCGSVLKAEFGALTRRGFIRAVLAGLAGAAVPQSAVAADPGAQPANKAASRTSARPPALLAYKTQLEVLWEGHDGKVEWFGPRVGVIPPNAAVLLMHRSTLSGSDVFSGMYTSRTEDGGKTWIAPQACQGLQRRPFGEAGVEICPCDLVPAWHLKSRRLLALGQTACYVPDAKVPVFASTQPIFASYSVYADTAGAWSEWKSLGFPDPKPFFLACGGAAQRVDLANGDILWPIYAMSYESVGANYNKSCFFSTVVRCHFDGQKLRYLEHGDELRMNQRRGYGEPSLTRFGNQYYLTLRNDLRGYVTSGSDGLRFREPIPWAFDDGTELGSYDTQQHWVTHSDGLFLVYTRRGANNDHVIRNRAPLFMAQVDPERLCVMRSSERILLPDKGGQYGNFGVVNVSPHETWVTEAEGMQGDAKKPYDIARTAKRGANNRVYLCRIQWEKPNHLASP